MAVPGAGEAVDGCSPLSDPGEVVQHPGGHKLEKRGLKTLWKLALGQLLFQLQFLGMNFVIKDMSLQLNGIKVNRAVLRAGQKSCCCSSHPSGWDDLGGRVSGALFGAAGSHSGYHRKPL